MPNRLTRGQGLLGRLTLRGPIKVTTGYGDQIKVCNKSGSSIAADKVVYISSYDATLGLDCVALADADAGSKAAAYITCAAIANNGVGFVAKRTLSAANLNTNSFTAVGDPVYLSTTAGGFTQTKPTAANALAQEVGRVTVKSATVGRIQWDIQVPPVAIGANELQAGAVVVAGLGTITDGVTLDQSGSGSTLEIKPNGVGAASLALLADGDLTPAPQVILQFTVADHATQNVDKVIAKKMVVTDVLVSSTGTNGSNANTVQLDNSTGGNHITDAISTNGLTAGQVARAALIDTTKNTIAAGATLRIIQTRAGGAHGFVVFVKGYLVA